MVRVGYIQKKGHWLGLDGWEEHIIILQPRLGTTADGPDRIIHESLLQQRGFSELHAIEGVV